MSSKKKTAPPAVTGDFDSLVSSIVHLHQQSQAIASKAVNVSLTLRNWLIGQRIVEFEQLGNDRAAYGEKLLPALAKRLSSAGLKRVDVRELRRFRLFYGVYPQIRETVTPELLAGLGAGALQPLLSSLPLPKRETLSPESQIVESLSPQLIYRLSFSHLAELLDLTDDTQRRFYEIECIRGNWSVRELRRQIASLYYQRSGLSKDKAKLSAMAHAAAETLQPAHIIRDPYIFEFLGLRSRDVMAESDLEDALLGFAGSAVVISHDRWFLDRIATHILAFEGNSEVVWFEGNYQEYVEDYRKRRGEDALQPHRIRYKPLTR